MICDRHQVVVVPFPFHEIAISKRRPVLVLSGQDFNRENGQTVVAMITTAKKTHWPSDTMIEDLDMAGLRTPCVVRLRLQTLPNEIIIRSLGNLAPLDRLRFEKQLAGMLT
ncbi:MAG: type II toxin-antitoxin system PemK/MazF family toxin [Rhizobiaceae bacterium]